MTPAIHLQRQLQYARIPFPEKRWLLEEIETDAASLKVQGDPEFFAFDSKQLARLEESYNNPLLKWLWKQSRFSRSLIEVAMSQVPQLALGIFILKEVPIMEFLNEGGMGMWLIILLGATGIGALLRQIFLFVIARDHSPETLALHNSRPLIIGAATLSVSLASTALGAYVVLRSVESGRVPPELLLTGLRESLSCLVVGGLMTACIFLLHWSLNIYLNRIRAIS